MTGIFGALRNFIFKHKFWSGTIVLLCVLGGWWVWSRPSSTTQAHYIMGSVQTNTIVSSVSESGQVTASHQLNVTPQVSGQIISMNVTPGQRVHAGQLIATIDPTLAIQAVQSAKENLQSAQLALAKLQQPATILTVTQQQNAISQAESMLSTQYQSSFGDITSSFLDLPNIMTALQSIDLGNTAGGNTQWNIDFYADQASKFDSNARSYRDAAYNDYLAARASYDQTFADFKNLSATPDQATIVKMLQETYTTAGLIATASKSSNSLIQFYSDKLTQSGGTPKAVAATQISSLTTYQNQTQSHISTLLNDQNAITSDLNSIQEKKQTLAQTQAGADVLDVQSSQLSVQKAQRALDEANTTLSMYYVTAPFSGTIAAVPLSRFDQAGSGSTLATLITTQQFADLSLNEVDAAKIQLGNKATLTFDAIPDLTLTGTVAVINPVGTVTQGVVTYIVRVGFDTQDPRVKTSMSVNAKIQTGVAQNVLTVPTSAVKTQNGAHYVQAFVPPIASSTVTLAGSQGVASTALPQNIPVEIGISDDTDTQITSGLTEGEQIIIRTLSGKTTAASATATTGGAGARAAGSTNVLRGL